MGRIQKIQRIQKIRNIAFLRAFSAPLVIAMFLSSCATYKTVMPDKGKVTLVTVAQEIPEAQLLDVRIQVFDPGTLPTSKNASLGLSEQVRKAEARYIPVQIKNAMQQTGMFAGATSPNTLYRRIA